MSYDPAKASFDIHATSGPVQCGDRAHAALVFVPHAYGGPISAEHAQVEVFDRNGSREAYVYPDGGAYRVFGGSTAAPGCASAAGNPLGLPSSKRCVDRRRFRFRLRQPRGGRIVSVTVFVNGRRVIKQRGRRIGSVALGRLPLGRFKVRIVAVTSLGRIVESTRTYSGCRKSRPRTRTHRGHRHAVSHA
jgi:hypothetical protein